MQQERSLVATATRLLPLLIGILITIFAWVITRWPFLRHYYSACFSPDYGSYVGLALQILDGGLPLFTDRTPGYPLFIAAITGIFGSNYAVLFAQALLSLFSSLVLVGAGYYYGRWLAPLIGLSNSAFFLLREPLTQEFTMLTESTYSSFLMLSAAALLLTTGKKASNWWIVASVCMAVVILIRPAGLFLVPIVGGLAAWLVLFRRDWSGSLKLALPFLAILLSLCSYNKVTARFFAITGFGEANLVAATSWFWHLNDDYPPKLKETLSKPMSELTPEQRDALENSWDFVTLSGIYAATYNTNLYKHLYKYSSSDFANDYNLQSADSNERYHAWRRLTRQIALDSIYHSPTAYAKFVSTQLYTYFWINGKWKAGNFYEYPLPLCYKSLYLDKDFAATVGRDWRERVLLEYFEPSPLGSFIVKEAPTGPQISLVETRSLVLQKTVQGWLQPYIATPWWGLATPVVFLLGFIVFLFSGLRSDRAAILIALASFNIFQAIVVCLVEAALSRYSSPLEFTSYLVVALLPGLFFNNRNHSEKLNVVKTGPTV